MPNAATLVQDKPYEKFSETPYGHAAGLRVALLLPVSGKRVQGIRALVDSGCEVTCIYPEAVTIDLAADVEVVPEAGGLLALDVEVESHVYHVHCQYVGLSRAGNEQMLLGMDILRHWRVTLDGPNQWFTIMDPQPPTPSAFRPKL